MDWFKLIIRVLFLAEIVHLFVSDTRGHNWVSCIGVIKFVEALCSVVAPTRKFQRIRFLVHLSHRRTDGDHPPTHTYTHIHRHTDTQTTVIHTHIHTHIHTYTHNHIRICTHTHIHTYTHTHIHTYTHTHINTDNHTHRHTHTYIYIYIYIYIYLYIHMHTYTNTETPTHTHTHTHMHTHMHMRAHTHRVDCYWMLCSCCGCALRGYCGFALVVQQFVECSILISWHYAVRLSA